MRHSNFKTYQCCLLLLELAYTAWRLILSSRLLLNLSVSREDDIDVWTCVCMVCCEALEHWQQMWQRIFLSDLNWDRFGVCVCYMIRGHTARQHTSTGHIYISQPEQEKVRLLTHATNFLGQCSPGAQHDRLAFRACKSTFSVTQE